MSPSQSDNPLRFLDQRSPVFSKECIASSSSPLATQVGLGVLREGGNAFDAAVAMAGMMAVVEPMFSGLGGDTMILAWSAADQRVYGLNGSGPAPSGASLERIGAGPYVPEHGAVSVTLPGALAGWLKLQDRFGSRSLEDLWQPAIRYAREGYPVGESIAGIWRCAAINCARHLISWVPPRWCASTEAKPGSALVWNVVWTTGSMAWRWVGDQLLMMYGPAARSPWGSWSERVERSLQARGCPTASIDRPRPRTVSTALCWPASTACPVAMPTISIPGFSDA
ncbi:gamma-glutamyltransferase [Synechococcus sp. ATX 2A4]|uniref:gamma-glutamyltransferase n=1 Tax=Synechococcus sp. ATX 2A4 TaxID=2823727 RepID=UPI0020CC04FD|nr:gamma-glutamyltransferase [Synechococcus sp. ATX 2A4]MCP9886277.1 gamma-glutamyltransferase [Synechococcus sp. ATX 2A4]